MTVFNNLCNCPFEMCSVRASFYLSLNLYHETSHHFCIIIFPHYLFSGWARLDTLINTYRNIKDNFLVLDVGNQFHGTLWFKVYRDEATSYFMNRTGYDAMVREYVTFVLFLFCFILFVLFFPKA